MPSLSDLTPIQARVLRACDDLQARGVYPTIEQIRLIVRATQETIMPARDFLLVCGFLVYTTRPKRASSSVACGACRPKAEAGPNRPRPHKPYEGPLHDTIREFDKAWRRVRKLNGKERVA